MLCHLSKGSICHRDLLLISASWDVRDFLSFSLLSLNYILVGLVDNVRNLIRVVRWWWPWYMRVLLHGRFGYFDEIGCALLPFNLVGRLSRSQGTFLHLLDHFYLRIFLDQRLLLLLLLRLLFKWRRVWRLATRVVLPLVAHLTRIGVVVTAQMRVVLHLVVVVVVS